MEGFGTPHNLHFRQKLTFGCGSKIGTQNGTLVNGSMDYNLRFSGGLILTHTRLIAELFEGSRELSLQSARVIFSLEVMFRYIDILNSLWNSGLGIPGSLGARRCKSWLPGNQRMDGYDDFGTPLASSSSVERLVSRFQVDGAVAYRYSEAGA